MHSPEDLIFQELASFASTHNLNLGVREVRDHARRVLSRLKGELVAHREAASILGVSLDMVHHYRNDGLIKGTPQNPNAARKHYLYELTDVLELKAFRSELARKRGKS